MTNILRDGSNWLQQQRKQHFSTKVTYRRDKDSVDVQATIGRTVFEQADTQGTLIRTEVRDYLIDASDLVLDGKPITPSAGDRIEEFVGNQKFVNEVMSIGGEPPWRYSDPYRTTYRIHTKHIATESA